MLIIRKEQMVVLERYARANFEKQALKRLRSTHFKRTKDQSDVDLGKLISSGIDKAIGYGMKEQPDIQRFLDYIILFGVDFDDDPEREWMREVLEDDSLEGGDKIAWLDDDLLQAGEA